MVSGVSEAKPRKAVERNRVRNALKIPFVLSEVSEAEPRKAVERNRSGKA